MTVRIRGRNYVIQQLKRNSNHQIIIYDFMSILSDKTFSPLPIYDGNQPQETFTLKTFNLLWCRQIQHFLNRFPSGVYLR